MNEIEILIDHMIQSSSQTNQKCIYDDLELYSAEIHMLSMISKLDGPHSSELVEILGITKGAISQTLKKLENKELVVRNHNRLYLSDKGKHINELHISKHRKYIDQYTSYIDHLNQHDRQLVLESLRLFIDLMEEVK